MFCPCGRSNKEWLEEEGLVDFIKKNMKKNELCCLSTFSSCEDLFQHIVNAEGYGSILYLGLVHYL